MIVIKIYFTITKIGLKNTNSSNIILCIQCWLPIGWGSHEGDEFTGEGMGAVGRSGQGV